MFAGASQSVKACFSCTSDCFAENSKFINIDNSWPLLIIPGQKRVRNLLNSNRHVSCNGTPPLDASHQLFVLKFLHASKNQMSVAAHCA